MHKVNPRALAVLKVFKLIKSQVNRFIPIHMWRRYKISKPYVRNTLLGIFKWLPLKTESDNFYYDLTEDNISTLATTLSVVTKQPFSTIVKYLDEIFSNENLYNNISSYFLEDPKMADSKIAFGRRIGWYALIRCIKPKIVLETGVHHGVGASIIVEALIKNSIEGNVGYYLGTDHDLNAGVLFNKFYSEFGKIYYGDSLESIKKIPYKIDLFINDSDHSKDYEASEYEAVQSKLSTQAIILGDNSHVTSALLEFSINSGRNFLFFKEEPKNHWYPGGGIGISYSR
jgi:hypothetical protein